MHQYCVFLWSLTVYSLFYWKFEDEDILRLSNYHVRPTVLYRSSLLWKLDFPLAAGLHYCLISMHNKLFIIVLTLTTFSASSAETKGKYQHLEQVSQWVCAHHHWNLHCYCSLSSGLLVRAVWQHLVPDYDYLNPEGEKWVNLISKAHHSRVFSLIVHISWFPLSWLTTKDRVHYSVTSFSIDFSIRWLFLN